MENVKGRIVKGLGGLYEIMTEDGSRIECRAKGVFRHEHTAPTVGDLVSVGTDELEIRSSPRSTKERISSSAPLLPI